MDVTATVQEPQDARGRLAYLINRYAAADVETDAAVTTH